MSKAQMLLERYDEALVSIFKGGKSPDDPQSILSSYKVGQEIGEGEGLLGPDVVKAIRTKQGYVAVMKDKSIVIASYNESDKRWEIVKMYKDELSILKKII